MRALFMMILVVAACGSKQPPPAATASAAPPTAAQPPAGGEMCPMMPPAGTQIVATDTSDGIAIAFTTTGDVAGLRAHVRRMAEMLAKMGETDHGCTAMGSGERMGSGDMHGRMMGGPMVPSRATVEDIPGGARLVLVPNDPAQVAALREHVRSHVAMMQQGKCPMMQQAQPAQPTDQHAQHHAAGE